MNKFEQFIDNIGWKHIVTWILVLVIFVTIIVLCVKVGKLDTTKEISSSAFTRGSLSESGKKAEDNTCIVMKNYESVDGLAITIDEDAEDIEYKVYFYDEEKDLISSTEVLDENFTSTSVPEDAEFFKVVIMTDGDEIGLFQVSKYAKMLTITVNK